MRLNITGERVLYPYDLHPKYAAEQAAVYKDISVHLCFIIPVIIAGNVFYHYAATDASASYQPNSQIFLSYLTELSDEALIISRSRPAFRSASM